MAMMPKAPGLFSITICWPRIGRMCSPTMRMTTSVALPGPNGTMTLIGLLGNFSCAVTALAATARLVAASRMKAVRFMSSSLVFIATRPCRVPRPCARDRIGADANRDRRTIERMTSQNHRIDLPPPCVDPVMTPTDRSALRRAVTALEHPGLAARLADMVGRPIELIGRSLPAAASEAIAAATSKGLEVALEVALRTMDHEPQ